MSADRVITCTNQDGDTITFTETGFYPFLLVSVDGVYDSFSNVNLMENTTTDGAIYQGGNTPYRNIVITVKDVSKTKSEVSTDEIFINAARIRGKILEILNAVTSQSSYGGQDFVEHRGQLDRVFKKHEFGRLSFKEGEQERVIDYLVEYVKPVGTASPSVRYHAISLICPDPFFYDPKDNQVFLSKLSGNFQFIHQFTASGEQFGYYTIGYNNIENHEANENIGMTIKITGSANIINPSITRMDDGEFIKIGTEEDPFTLEAGDSLIITTENGNKHVYLMVDGNTTEINYRMVDGSTFIQIMRGNNNMFFTADAGRNTATVEILYRLQYPRA